MRCVMKHTLARTILCTQVSTMLKQRLQNNEICTFACIVQRSLVKIVARINICAVFQQQTNDFHITTETRSMKTDLAVEA